MTFAETIEYANSRGVGQFHVFHRGWDSDDRERYHSSWGNLLTAQRIMRSLRHGRVYNSSGDDVTDW